MTQDDRRRQLVGIGLRKFVERPVQELSLDEVAAEAGVSRGLLFHYFPTKTDFHQAVVQAAGRRVLRTVRPDEDAAGEVALRQIVERYVEQIQRRRASYIALVFGQPNGVASLGGDVVATLRTNLTTLVIDTVGLPTSSHDVVHGWVAYVEDRALELDPHQGTRTATTAATAATAAVIAHCVAALHALIALSPS